MRMSNEGILNCSTRLSHGRILRGGGGGRGSGPPPPPEKIQNYRVSLQCWSGSSEKSQGCQAGIQCYYYQIVIIISIGETGAK